MEGERGREGGGEREGGRGEDEREEEYGGGWKKSLRSPSAHSVVSVAVRVSQQQGSLQQQECAWPRMAVRQ